MLCRTRTVILLLSDLLRIILKIVIHRSCDGSLVLLPSKGMLHRLEIAILWFIRASEKQLSPSMS